MTAQDQYIYNYITTHTQIGGPYTIPVVVHVLHYGDAYGTGTNIEYDQILWQIAGMNAAFLHDYANYNQEGYGHNYASYGFQDYSSNPQVRFCLAERGRDSALNVIPFFYNTMSGDTECGVMRYDLTNPMFSTIPNIDSLDAYNITNIADEQTLLDVTRPGTEFPNAMYLNIYLVPEMCETFTTPTGPQTSCNVIGIGTFGPFSSLTGQLDGIVFRSDVFGDNSVQGNTFPLLPFLDKGKIMDHEAGHYLSLYHTFQPDSAMPFGCYGTQLPTAATQQCDQHGDFCCDTPPDTNRNTLPFVPLQFTNSCNETYFAFPTDHRDMNENYMDYSDDEWYNTFTFDQSMRISAMLDVGGPRHSLVTPANHTLTGIADTGACHCCLLVAHIIQDRDTLCPGVTVNYFTPSGNGFCATAWNWSFPGGTPATGTGTNQSIVYNTPGIYPVYLTATNGTDSILDSSLVVVLVPTVTITGINTTDTVCTNSQQNINVAFTGGLPPYNVTICDQNNNVVSVLNNINDTVAIILVPATLGSNVFHICSATNGLGCQVDTIVGTTSFLVMDCCDNLFRDGEFEDFLTPGCNIAPSTTDHICGGYQNTRYNTYNPTATFATWPVIPGNNGQNGISMVIDGYGTPTHTTPIDHVELWSQPVALEQGVDYSLQFDISGHRWTLGGYAPIPGQFGQNLWVQWKVNGVFIGTPIHVPDASPGTQWHTFVMDYSKITPNSVDTFTLCQIRVPMTGINFNTNFFDYLIDNMTIRAKDIPVVFAGTDTVLCPGNYANIGSLLNDPDGVYTWTNNNFVTCDTCFFTTANPPVYTQYELVNQQRGCIVRDTVDIFMLDVNAGSDIIYCDGGPVTIAPTIIANAGSYTVLWQPGGQTTDSITVSPTVITTYVVTVTDTVSNCTNSDTIRVYPGSLSVTLNDTTNCIGSAVPLTPTITGNIGALSYLWLPGNQTTPTIFVGPSSPTTYTVIVTDSLGCSDTATATVSPSAIGVVATANPNPACIGSFIQLLATPTGVAPFAYTWLPAINLSNSAISNPTITSYDGVTITYTVFIADAQGCSSSDTVQITVDPACCTAPNSMPDTLFTNITGGNYAVNQDLYIFGNRTISGADLLIGTNHSIIVLTGSTLTITGASHLHACYQMWQGIILRPGANIVVNGNSLIEDAYTAINCVSAPAATISLTNTIFNKNQIAVLAQTWAGALSFSMVNCRITCRQLPPAPTVAMLTPGFLTGLPQASLMAPLTGQRAFSGVQFINGGTISIGSPGATNIFDYLDHGIIGVNTNFIVRNNRFQNMLKLGVGPQYSSSSGTAIISNDPTMVVGNPATYNTVQIGGASSSVGNTFIDCWRSVDITRYVNVTVMYNRINSTSTVIAPPNTTNLNGDHGLFIRTTYALVMEVRNNDIRNQARGIHINLSAGGLGYNTINVRDNFLTAAITPTTFTTVGIQVDGISGVFFVTNNFLNIEGDTVLNANTCIQVRNIRNAVRVFSNGELKIRPNPTTTPGSNRTGIFVQNCEFVFIQDNLNIHSTGTALDSNNRNIRGIWVFNCAQSTVCNNWIRQVGQCLVFEGSCQFSTVRLNRFSFAYDGFVLRNNAIIGQQGNSTHPMDCHWFPSLTNDTYTDATTNCNGTSPIWVRPLGNWNPTNNVTNQTLADIYSPNLIPGIFVAAACGATPPTMLSQQTLRQNIAQNQIAYTSYPNESRVSTRKRLYSELNDNPALMVGDTILQNFYSNSSTANIGYINIADDEIEQGNSVSASATNANIVPLTNSEWNQQVFNSIFLATLMQGIDTLTSQQMTDLVVIAEQCPNQGGDAVWQARAMVDWVTHSANDFGDSCTGENTRLIGADSTLHQQSNVYPNPNAGSVTVEYELHETSNATFEVLDLTGRVISVTRLDTKQTQQIIDLVELANGPYIYKIIGDGDLVDTGTLIISK